MDDDEHEVYGGEIPEETDMDADVEMPNPDDVDPKVYLLILLLSSPGYPNPNPWSLVFQELDEMKKRLKEMEEEAAALREMQAKVEKEMGGAQGHEPPFINPVLLYFTFDLSILLVKACNGL